MTNAPGQGGIRNLTPEEVADGLSRDAILLVDVREPHEIAMERIAGAVFLPMSRFDPDDIPDPGQRSVVFLCASGIRSVRASEIAQASGLQYNAHLAGGLKAWKATGLPTER